MAETIAGRELTNAHRAAQAQTWVEFERMIAAFWPTINLNELPASQLQMLFDLVAGARTQSIQLATGYMMAFTQIEAGVAAKVVTPAMTPSLEQAIKTSLRVTGQQTYLTMRASGYAPEYASQSALSSVVRASRRHALDGGRATVMETVRADPVTVGWRRIGVGETCVFCRMLIGRGEVYSADTAKFSSHDNCDCQAEPAYGGEPIKLNQYIATKRNISASEKETLRNYLREMDGKEPTKRGYSREKLEKPAMRDVDEGKSAAELRAVLTPLERSLTKFESPGTRRRVEDLRRKIAERS